MPSHFDTNSSGIWALMLFTVGLMLLGITASLLYDDGRLPFLPKKERPASTVEQVQRIDQLSAEIRKLRAEKRTRAIVHKQAAESLADVTVQLNAANAEAESLAAIVAESRQSNDSLRADFEAYTIANPPATFEERGHALRTSEALTEARADLAATNAKIATARHRYRQAVDVINQFTYNKTAPVKEGSYEYQRCQAASVVIAEVEANAPKLLSEKARLETLIKELEATEQP